MGNKIIRERLQEYETAIKEVCSKCNKSIELARRTFLEAKNSARSSREKAITKLKQEFES